MAVRLRKINFPQSIKIWAPKILTQAASHDDWGHVTPVCASCRLQWKLAGSPPLESRLASRSSKTISAAGFGVFVLERMWLQHAGWSALQSPAERIDPPLEKPWNAARTCLKSF